MSDIRAIIDAFWQEHEHLPDDMRQFKFTVNKLLHELDRQPRSMHELSWSALYTHRHLFAHLLDSSAVHRTGPAFKHELWFLQRMARLSWFIPRSPAEQEGTVRDLMRFIELYRKSRRDATAGTADTLKREQSLWNCVMGVAVMVQVSLQGVRRQANRELVESVVADACGLLWSDFCDGQVPYSDALHLFTLSVLHSAQHRQLLPLMQQSLLVAASLPTPATDDRFRFIAYTASMALQHLQHGDDADRTEQALMGLIKATFRCFDVVVLRQLSSGASPSLVAAADALANVMVYPPLMQALLCYPRVVAALLAGVRDGMVAHGDWNVRVIAARLLAGVDKGLDRRGSKHSCATLTDKWLADIRQGDADTVKRRQGEVDRLVQLYNDAAASSARPSSLAI
ncbi:hypothetical protein RI367_002843 [Sorochytrium milnesiophthora]